MSEQITNKFSGVMNGLLFEVEKVEDDNFHIKFSDVDNGKVLKMIYDLTGKRIINLLMELQKD